MQATIAGVRAKASVTTVTGESNPQAHRLHCWNEP
jgi:hypothetical protein